MSLTAVSPSSGWNGGTTRISIHGTGFYPSVTVSARSGETSFSGGHRVELLRDGEAVAQLGGVSLIDPSRIDATVPAGLEIGRYDLAVQGPQGPTAVLPGAFSVKSTRADRLVLTPTAPAPFWIVDEVAAFDIAALDADGAPLTEPLPVRLSLQAVDGRPIVAGFADGILLDQVTERSSTGASIIGRLRLDGTARAPLSVATPGTVQLSLTSLEPDIQGATIHMAWFESADYHLTVELPFPSFDAVAGQEFMARVAVLDRDGAAVASPVYPVHAQLTDSCGEIAVDLANLAGVTQVPIRLNQATGPHGCAPLQTLNLHHRDQTVASAPFRVQPTAASRLEIELPGSIFVAGNAYAARVRAVDLHGNRTPYPGEGDRLTLTDTAGDLDVQGCQHDDRYGELECIFIPTIADPTVLMIARDLSVGLAGASMPYAVKAGPLAQIGVDVDVSSTVRAGTRLSTHVSLLDAFGNAYEGAPFPFSAFSFHDALGAPIACEPLSESIAHLELQCEVTRAHDLQRIVVDGPRSLSGTSEPFALVNAELAYVTLDPETVIPTAGQSVRFEISAFDRFDNPYRDHDAPVIELTEVKTGAWPSAVSLDHEGRGSGSLTFTVAGITHVQASHDGTPLGVSEPITVSADDPVAIRMVPERPWAWVGRSVRVELRAVDRFDNTADVAEPVEVFSRDGAFIKAGANLDHGRASLEILSDRAVALDRWSAESSGGLLSDALDIPVVEDCGSHLPSPSLWLDGAGQAIRCATDDGVSVSARVDTGTHEVDRYAYWVPGHTAFLSDRNETDLLFYNVGTHPVTILVAEGTCGAEATGVVYVGADDGSPAGPIPVTLATSTLRVDQDTTDIDIGPVLDCAGDVVDRGDILLRTDRGSVGGASASGTGLFVTLDGMGRAEATLDLTEARTGGPGQVVLWTDDGAAHGVRSFTATGDLVSPRVVEQHPEGATTGAFASIMLSFTEPLDPATFDLQGFKIIGPTAASVDRVLQPQPHQLELVLGAPVSSTAGRWTVQIRDSLADAAGNGLDGEWVGEPSDYDAEFGAVSASAPSVSSCTRSTDRFRPDGDDGDGVDADQVSVTVTAASTPGSWRIAVFDEAGTPVRHDRLEGSSSTEIWAWDGRDNSERIVGDGRYSVRVTAHNADGTGGDACSVVVAVDNERGM